jgi:Na+-transporting methylmalonyl-CoA/oxaloacetate decarboxylase gamma subunit
VAEIRIERKQRSLLPWFLGLVLLVLVIWGVAKMMNRNETPGQGSGAAAADTRWDDTPPQLRQYALASTPGLRAA